MMVQRSTLVAQALKASARGPVRRMARRLGYEVVARERDSQLVIAMLMRERRIATLIDVGANQGQYAEHIRSAGFAGAILSFEPGEAAYSRLVATARCDPRWETRRMALGENADTLTLHVSANSVSSSLLEIGTSHVAAAPGSAPVSSERVEVQRLDTQVPPDAGRLMLKLDTQGYELPVLRGASKVMDDVHVIQVELSFIELYSGQATYLDVLKFLNLEGFEPWLVLPGFSDPASGRMLQADVVACRVE